MNADQIAAATNRHAEAILRASGSSLRNYEMPATRSAIFAAVLACIEEAYREGAAFGAAYAAGDKA